MLPPRCPENSEPLLIPTATASTASSSEEDDIAKGRVIVCPVDATPEGLDSKRRPKFSFRTFIRYAGPGWLMSLAYLDPGNLEADLQSGVYTGFQLSWVMLVAHAVGLLLQCLSARLGFVTGKSLAQHCRAGYGKRTGTILWILTEIAIIGSDIQEVLGSAVAFRLLFGIPLWIGCIITAADTFTFMAAQYLHGTRVLEGFVVSIIMIMCACFFANLEIVKPEPIDVALGFVPSVASYAVVQMVGVVGAVIMPHNIYLHSSLISSTRRVDRRNPRALEQASLYFSLDATVALVVSFMINTAIMTSFAQGFFSPHCAANPSGTLGCNTSASVPGLECVLNDCSCTNSVGQQGFCTSIGLSNGGSALASLMGSSEFAATLFAIGVLAAGQASTMTGSLAGQYVMEGFLGLHVPLWLRLLITRSIALVPALAVAIWQTSSAGNSASSLSAVNDWLNILQSVQLPFALLPLLHFVGDPRVMGHDWAIGRRLKSLCWACALALIVINAYLLHSQLATLQGGILFMTLGVAAFMGYLTLMAIAAHADEKWWVRPIAGAFASQTADFFTYPIDTSKTRLQLSGEAGGAKRYNGMADAIKKVYHNEGPTGLYKGFSAALVRQGLYRGLVFALYEPLRDETCKLLGEDKSSASLKVKILAGGVGGIIGSALINPVDVIKVRMQGDLKVGAERRYRNVFDGLYKMYKAEGMKGISVGVIPNMQRAFLVNAAELATYDQCKEEIVKVFGDNTFSYFVSSMIAGLVAAIVSTPVDVAKTRLMNQDLTKGRAYKGLTDCLVKTVKSEGVFALYKGFIPNWVRIGPYTTIAFIAFEEYRKQAVSIAMGPNPRSKPSTGYNEFKRREKQQKFQRKAKQVKKYHRMLQHEGASESVATGREDYEDRLFNPFGKPRVTQPTGETTVAVEDTDPAHLQAPIADDVSPAEIEVEKNEAAPLAEEEPPIDDEPSEAPPALPAAKELEARKNPFKKEQRLHQKREAERERQQREKEEREEEIKNQKIRAAKERRAHGRLLSARTKKGQPKMHLQLESMMRRYKKKHNKSE
ncbi:hypothetical protein FOL47_008969 [Perkinsus chesapeaki]|uniref:Uncharacterized protein n=1 Tax=Perkinsus chesapeaki TaxID=330153 RepID=A0A7J6N205_PERCH|nr:hypothetical protein FOL47_008969 [Perkinsus chesapeaki]